eukprot:TRINITY_DN13044_c0_g1_i2.p1 TRINITY_DN13044_c0_g1~~TRINITY_DN13044_c0_g1_i2.p1  ORF type:complete len:115 (-),score=20.37 TRINITY_DN13044_c0_g1_i2:871-1215(-)
MEIWYLTMLTHVSYQPTLVARECTYFKLHIKLLILESRFVLPPSALVNCHWKHFIRSSGINAEYGRSFPKVEGGIADRDQKAIQPLNPRPNRLWNGLVDTVNRFVIKEFVPVRM